MKRRFLFGLIGAALLIASPAQTQETPATTSLYIAPTIVVAPHTRIDQSHIINAGLRAGYRFSRLSAWAEATRLDLGVVCIGAKCRSRGSTVVAGLAYNGTAESRVSPFLSLGAGLVRWAGGGTEPIGQARFGMEIRVAEFVAPQLGVRLQTYEGWSPYGGLELAIRIGA